MHIRPIRNHDDIAANTKIVDDRYIQTFCPLELASLEALGSLERIHWPDGPKASDSNGSDFTMTKNYAHALELFRDGWKDGTKRAENIIKRLNVRIQTYAPRDLYRPSVAPVGGLVLNYGDLATSGPSPFIGRHQTEEVQRGRKIIRVCLNSAASCAVEASILAARGACVIAFIKMLERHNLSTSIDVISAVARGWSDAPPLKLMTWHIKDAGQDVPMDRLAFALGHPSSLRRIGFAQYEHLPAGWGQQGNYEKPAALKTLPEITKMYDVVIDSDSINAENQHRWTNPAAQEIWIKDQLKKQGLLVK